MKTAVLMKWICLMALVLNAVTGFAGTVRVAGDQILFDGASVDVIGLRCSNALLSDRTADDLIAALDLYTEEMKQDQIDKTIEGIETHNGIVLASTWLQCGPAEGVGGPFTDPGGLSDMGSEKDLTAAWNREIDRLHPDAGVRWWFNYVRDQTGSGQ